MERTNRPNLDDVRQQAEYDRHMSMARVCRMRGDYAQAAESVRLALQVRPSDPDATEFAADILAARGEVEKALDIYKALREADASRSSADEKFARLTIQIAEGKRQQALLQDMAENPQKYRIHQIRRTPNPAIAAALSFVPGLGHLYCGLFTKGLTLFATITTAWFFAGLLGLDFKMMAGNPQNFINNVDPLSVFILCVASSLHMYAFVDAPVYANKLKEKETKGASEPE